VLAKIRRHDLDGRRHAAFGWDLFERQLASEIDTQAEFVRLLPAAAAPADADPVGTKARSSSVGSRRVAAISG
jgi:hypothetical protein